MNEQEWLFAFIFMRSTWQNTFSYGSGINPDSALTSGKTVLVGNLKFISGADSGLIQGITIEGNIYFGTNAGNQTLSYFSISRCLFNDLNLSFNGTTATTSNFLVRESVIIGYVNGGYSHAVFNNNVIELRLNYFSGAIFSNNLFLYDQFSIYYNVTNSTFSNNIYSTNCIAANNFGSTDNNYYNNLIRGGFIQFWGAGGCLNNYSYNGNGSIAGNIENVPSNLIYQNQSGNTFVFQQNYHLKPASPGINAGTDGTDVGIYGGPNPFKEGSLPVNPHYRMRLVSGTTNAAGQLPVHFKAAAQDH